MRKELSLMLKAAAEDIARKFSNTDRAFNFNGESFVVSEIVPLSESTAAVIFEKTGGKKALAFLYYINGTGGYWQYFFPSDSHVLGMQKLGTLLDSIERYNFGLNFVQEKEVVTNGSQV